VHCEKIGRMRRRSGGQSRRGTSRRAPGSRCRRTGLVAAEGTDTGAAGPRCGCSWTEAPLRRRGFREPPPSSPSVSSSLSELAHNTDGVTRAWGGVDARFRAASCLFSTHAQLRTMPVSPTHRIDLALCGICWAEKQHQSRLGDDFGCHIRGSHVTATPGLKFLLNAKAAT